LDCILVSPDPLSKETEMVKAKKEQHSNVKPSEVSRSNKSTGSELKDSELKGVTGGRDAASGLPTGKRSHKPVT